MTGSNQSQYKSNAITFFIRISIKKKNCIDKKFMEGINLVFIALLSFSSFPLFKRKMFFKEFVALFFAFLISGSLSLPIESIESPYDKWERQLSTEDSN